MFGLVALHKSAEPKCWIAGQDSILYRAAQHDSEGSNREADGVLSQPFLGQFCDEALDVITCTSMIFFWPNRGVT